MRNCFLACAALLAACGSNAKEAEDIAARGLNDPASAQFRDVRKVGEHCVTGELNAKNRMGAYTGFRGFIVDMRKREAAIVNDPPIGEPRSDDVIADARVAVFAQDCGIEMGSEK